MKGIFLILILVFATLSNASENYKSYSKEDMYNITSGALLQRDDVKLLEKNLESWTWGQIRYLGLKEKYVSPVVMMITPLLQNKISTKSVQFKWSPLENLTLRPDLEYYLSTKETDFFFNVGWLF